MKYAIKYCGENSMWVGPETIRNLTSDKTLFALANKSQRTLFRDKGRARAICRLMRRENECPYVVVRVKA